MRSTTKKPLMVGATVVAAVALTAGAMALSSAATAQSTDKVPTAQLRSPLKLSGSAGTSYGIAALDRPQEAADRLPKAIDPSSLGNLGVIPSTTRLLRAGSDATYWASLDAQNELCLVVALPDPEFNGSSCTTPSDFSKVALAFRLIGPSSGAEAYLIPDSARPAVAKAALAASAESGSNLVVENPLASTTSRSTLAASTPGYDLGVLSAPKVNDLPPALRAQVTK